MEMIKAQVAGLGVEQLKEMATMLMRDYREGTDLVFQVVMGALESRMPETDFVTFCDSF